MKRILVLLALLCAVSPAVGASNVEMAVTVGFNDTFRPGRWTPIAVTVTNHGADLSGELEVQVAGGSELRGGAYVSAYRRNLDLQRSARKTLHFTVLPQSLFQPLIVRVRSGARDVARTEIDLRGRVPVHERLLLVLSRDANLDYLNDRTDQGVRALNPHPELLPVHWRGYDGVSAIIVHGISLERLSTLQFEALRKWIAQGGILAVSGGPEYALLRTPRLGSLLPGIPEGITAIEPGALKEVFAASLDHSRPAHVHRVNAYAGSAVLRAADVPLIIERTFGRGRVLYFTFDVAGYPFHGWSGMRALLMEQLRMPASAAPLVSGAEPTHDGPLAALIRAESADFPSYLTVLVFLTLYLGLLGAGYQLVTREGRSRWLALLWTWTAPALFALAAWTLFGPAVFPRGPSAVTVAVVEPLPDSSYARISLDIGMYANRSGAFRLEYRGAEPALNPRPAQRGGTSGNWVFGEGPRAYLEPQTQRRYVLHALQGDDVIPFDLKATVYDESSGPRLVISNASGRMLEDLRLVFAGYVYDIGAVAADANHDRRLVRGTHGTEVGKTPLRDLLKPPAGWQPHMLEPARLALDRRAQAAGTNGHPDAGYALLIGHTASPLRPAGESANWPRRERAVVAFQVPAATNALSSQHTSSASAQLAPERTQTRQPFSGAEAGPHARVHQ